jgi:CTP:phosphocholine cytidylyltransferase-like protein
MDCVLVAGGRPRPEDPLFPYTQGGPKALLQVGDRSLIDYILQALLEARSIDRIVVVGLERMSLGNYGPEVEFVSDQHGMIANGLAGLAKLKQHRPETRHVLFASADIPMASGPMIDELVNKCSPFDKGAYYFMVERHLLEKHYPDSKRTYVKLRDVEVAGADIFIADARLADGNRQLLTDVAAARKRPWKMARIAGLTTILALLARRLTLAGVEQRASQVLGAPVSVSLLDNPHLAMDIDKPEQLLILRRHLP